MQLRIDKFVPATVTHVNKRTENHGNSLKHAIDLFWKMNCPNTSLDAMFGDAGKSLRHGAYERADSDDIPGTDSATPKLRAIFALIKGPHTLKFEGTGYMLTIKTGEVSNETVELADTEMGKADYDPKDGGSTTITFKSSHSGLTKKMLGELSALDGREVSILCAPPVLQEGTQPDKKKAAGAKDDKTLPLPLGNPKQPKKPTKDAGQQFAEDVAAGKTKPATAPAKKAPAKKGVSLKAKMALNARKRGAK